MKILIVVGDESTHSVAQIVGHEVTIVSGFKEAAWTLFNEKFDVVLTSTCMQYGDIAPDPLFAYGFSVVLMAVNQGIKSVALPRDHSDRNGINGSFDYMSGSYRLNETKFLVMDVNEACAEIHPTRKVWVRTINYKDWMRAIKILVDENCSTT